MAKSYVVEVIAGDATFELPATFTREIGRIVVRWANFEHYLQDMIWQAAGVSPAVGRVAIREPRVTDRLEMLSELISLRGTWDTELHKSILARARLLGAKRDLLAHGLWHHHKRAGEWHVQLARGTWPKDRAALVRGGKKITPESVAIDLATLKSATSEIDRLIEDARRLATTAEGQTPSL